MKRMAEHHTNIHTHIYSRPEGIQTKGAMRHRMALSSCRTRSCRDEVHMCAFNLSANEMSYQSASEKLLSVQVFMCQCLCMCVCV